MILRYIVENGKVPAFTASKKVENEMQAVEWVRILSVKNRLAGRMIYTNANLFSDSNALLKHLGL